MHKSIYAHVADSDAPWLWARLWPLEPDSDSEPEPRTGPAEPQAHCELAYE